MRFQVLFHSPLGVLFTFPSRYWFTIGHRVVLSLGRWASQIHTGFHVTRATWEYVPGGLRLFRLRDYHLLWFVISRHIRLESNFVTSREVHTLLKTYPTTPQAQQIWLLTYLWFGLFRVRSPLLTESLFAFRSSRY